MKTRVRVCKIHLREGVEEWPDLGCVGSKAAMDVRLFPHGAVGGSLSNFLAANHAKCWHNQLQAAQQKNYFNLLICDKTTGRIILLDGVKLLHMREDHTWLERCAVSIAKLLVPNQFFLTACRRAE